MSTVPNSSSDIDINLPDKIKYFSRGRVNSEIILGNRGTAVIDTQVTLDDAKELLQEATLLSGEKPLLYVIITHEHFDHIAGNQLFPCDIVSSHETAKAVRTMMDREMGRPVEEGLMVTPPTITFGSSCEISLGDLTLVIRHYGGHSPGESAVYIPELKALVTGDLVFNGGQPFVGSGDIPRWISALSELYLLSPDFVIPGHGLPGGKRILVQQRTILESFYDHVIDAQVRGIPADEAAEEYCASRSVPEGRQSGFVKAAQGLYGLKRDFLWR